MAGTSAQDLDRLLPEEPRWIDLKGLLRTGRCDLWTEPDPTRGFVARSWDYPFGALYGRPSPARIRAAVAAGRAARERQPASEKWQFLAPEAARPSVESALPGWKRTGIVLHRWPGGRHREIPCDAEIRLLAEGHRRARLPLDHVPESSRRELEIEWVSTRPMAVALVDSRPVSFCYAAFTTEKLWDVSIETLEPYRRRGLAAASFVALAAFLAQRGLTPAWGSMLDNPASLRLAAKLGFERDATIDGWSESPP